MGQKRKQAPSAEELFPTISRMLVPEYILENFEIYGAEESPSHWMIELREKEGTIPPELKECKDVVFDGYTNPIEILSHSFVCKPIYLRIYRRRYKRTGTNQHYSNTYDLTLKGVKMVPELGIFLKDDDRIFTGESIDSSSGISHTAQNALSLVSKSFKRLPFR